jgi:hypothetical protein
MLALFARLDVTAFDKFTVCREDEVRQKRPAVGRCDML